MKRMILMLLLLLIIPIFAIAQDKNFSDNIWLDGRLPWWDGQLPSTREVTIPKPVIRWGWYKVDRQQNDLIVFESQETQGLNEDRTFGDIILDAMKENPGHKILSAVQGSWECGNIPCAWKIRDVAIVMEKKEEKTNGQTR